VLNNPALLEVLANSVIISVGTTLLTLSLAVPGAYALARLRLPGSRVMLLFLLVGQLLPSIVIAGPLFVIFSRIGLLNSHLGLILADTTFTLPFAIIMLRPFFLAVPGELEAAGKIDGCSQLGVLWRIVIPTVRAGLITVAAFVFLIREYLAEIGVWHFIILGTVSIAIILIEPKGLWGMLRRVIPGDLIPVSHAPRRKTGAPTP
jgi:multiple sugar transport system permease protein